MYLLHTNFVWFFFSLFSLSYFVSDFFFFLAPINLFVLVFICLSDSWLWMRDTGYSHIQRRAQRNDRTQSRIRCKDTTLVHHSPRNPNELLSTSFVECGLLEVNVTVRKNEKKKLSARHLLERVWFRDTGFLVWIDKNDFILYELSATNGQRNDCRIEYGYIVTKELYKNIDSKQWCCDGECNK